MEAENHLIKNLLISLGFSAALVKRYLQFADQSTVADRKVAIPAATGRPVEAYSATSCQYPCSMSSQVTPSVPAKEKDQIEQPSLKDNLQPASTVLTQLTQESTEVQQRSTTSSPCKKSMTEQLASEPRPHHQNAFNTTPCVAAEELLDQHNAQGIDMDELRRRICPGVKETELGCC
jgi:hypothetical protein